MRLAPLFVIALFATSAAAQPPVDKKDAKPGVWTGQKVMARAGAILITRVEGVDDDGNPVTTNHTGLQMEYLVRNEQPDDVFLRTRDGHEGWVPKEQLVRMKDAEAFFTKQIEDEPEQMLFYQLRAHARRSREDLKGATDDISEAIRLAPDSAELFNHRALLWQSRKEDDKAMQDFDEAIRLKPESGLIRCNRAGARLKKKHYPAAIEDFEEAIKLQPTSAVPYNGLAWVLCTCVEDKVRDGRRAVTLAEKAVELTERKVGSYVDTLAAAYAEVGRFEDAVRAQQQALEDRDFLLEAGNGAFSRLELFRQRKAYRGD